MKEEILINTQFALFFEELLEKPENIWQDLDSKLGGISESPPLIIPVPHEPALNGVPVVQILSDIYRLNIARQRTDLFIAGVGQRADFSSVKEDLINKAQTLTEIIKELIPIKWIGLVVRFFVEEENFNTIISNGINDNLKNISKGSISESSIRYTIVDKIIGVESNNILEINIFKAKIANYGENIPGLLITRDFNTKPAQSIEGLDKDFIKKFILNCETNFKLEEIKSILWKQ